MNVREEPAHQPPEEKGARAPWRLLGTLAMLAGVPMGPEALRLRRMMQVHTTHVRTTARMPRATLAPTVADAVRCLAAIGLGTRPVRGGAQWLLLSSQPALAVDDAGAFMVAMAGSRAGLRLWTESTDIPHELSAADIAAVWPARWLEVYRIGGVRPAHAGRNAPSGGGKPASARALAPVRPSREHS